MSKNVLVTGATRGIGRAVVTRLLREGYDISFTWFASGAAAEDIQEQASELGRQSYPYKCDLTDMDQVQQLTEALLHGPELNGIVYCATAPFTPTYAADLSLEDWNEALKINLISPSIVCSRVGRHLRKQGAIITVSSPNASVCQEGMSTYAASKAALESFSRVLARELGPQGVRVNVVRPGPTMTDGLMAQVPDQGVIDELSAATPLGRIAQPEDIADAIFLLLGNDTRWLSGDVLNLSGGLF